MAEPTSWLLISAFALVGVLTHWLKQLALARKATPEGFGRIDVKTYWLTYWPETLTMVTSTLAGIALLHELNYLSPVAAFGVGYLGNSAADLVGGRVQAMINAAATPLQK
jgi:hypothetical protein